MSGDDKLRKWFRAIQSGDLNEVERLLPECAGLCGDFGETGLQYAVQMKNPTLVQLLIDYEVGIANNEGCTALIMAALNNSADLCSILAPLEADIILPDRRDAYMIAAQVGSYDALVALRSYFSLVTDSHDLNALDYASMTGNLRCVDEIVTHYKPSEQERVYSRALAENEGHHAVVQYFDTGNLDHQACESSRLTDGPALTTEFTMQSSMLPAQGVQSPRIPLNNLTYSNVTVERQKSIPDSTIDADFDEAIADLVDEVPKRDAPEQSPTRRKATKDKGSIKTPKAEKKQKQKHIDDSKLVHTSPLDIHKFNNGSPDGFSSLQSQIASKDSYPYELLRTNQRSKSGMCGSRVGRKGGFTQSSSAILPLLERKDTEIRNLQSQLEALTLRRSTLMTDSFAMVDACTSCCAEGTSFCEIVFDSLLNSKDEFIERLLDLCIPLFPSSATKRIDVCVGTDFASTLLFNEVPVQGAIQNNAACEKVEEYSYESLLKAKDLEIDRLQKMLFDIDIKLQPQSKREAKLCRELEAKILKEVELIGIIDEMTQEIKALKDKVVLHKKVLADIQQQGFISDRRTERDIRLEDLFDQTLRSCDVVREIKQQMIAFKAEFSGYIAQTELLARTLFNEGGANDLNKSLKRSASCSKINPLNGTGRIHVPNPPNPMSVTLHPPTRSSSFATLQPLKPPLKPTDYSGLLQNKDSCIDRLVALLYVSPNTLYQQPALFSHPNTIEEKEVARERHEEILAQKDQIINDLRRELETLFKSISAETVNYKKESLTHVTKPPDMVIGDLLSGSDGEEDSTEDQKYYMEALAKLELEHAAMQMEIDTMAKTIAERDNAIMFFADHYTKRTNKSAIATETAKVITALELEITALKSQLQATKQEITLLRNEAKAVPRSRSPTVIGIASARSSEDAPAVLGQTADPLCPIIIPSAPPRRSSLAQQLPQSDESSKDIRASSPSRTASLLRQTITRAKSRTASRTMQLKSQYAERTGLTKLMQAVIDGDARAIGMHLSLLCLVTDDGTSALMLAAIHNRLFAIEYLIHGEAGLVDNNGKTALIHALEKGHIRIAEILTPYECPDVTNVDITHTGSRTTELMTAVLQGDLARAWALLPMQHGIRDKNGKTALILAIELRRPAFVRILLPLEHTLCLEDGSSPLDAIMSLKGSDTSICEIQRIAAEYFGF